MKYSSEKTKEICEFLQTGSTRTDACTLVDISYETFCQWMKKPEFSEAIKKAEIKNKQRSAALIQKAAETTWQAAAWWLERKYPDEFGARQRLDHAGHDGGPLYPKELTDARNLETVLLTYERVRKKMNETKGNI